LALRYVLLRWSRRAPNKIGRFVVQIGESRFSFAHEATVPDAVAVPVAAPHVTGDDDTFVASSFPDENEEWK